MTSFQENYFNEENRLRNVILFDEKIFNYVFNNINDLFEQNKNEIGQGVKSFDYNGKKFIIIEKKNKLNILTLFVFSFGLTEKINFSVIHSSIENSNLTNMGSFVLSVKKREIIGEKINATERVEFLRMKMSELNESNEKIVYMLEHLKSNFLVSNNYLSNVYDFYQYLNKVSKEKINIIELFNIAEKDNINYGNRIVEGLIERIKLIKSASTNKYQEVYKHKIKLKNGLLVIKNEGSCFAVKQENENISIYEIDKDHPLKSINSEKFGNEPYENTILEMKSGKIVYFEKQTYDRIFRIFIQSIYLVLRKEEKIKEEERTKDIMNYQYQKGLFFFLYGKNEFDFVASALLNSSDFSYNDKSRCFYARNYGYVKVDDLNIEKYQLNRNSLDYINNSTPLREKMFILNEEWIEGVKVLLNILEKERPLPIVHYGKSPDESVDEAIAYCKELILFNQ